MTNYNTKYWRIEISREGQDRKFKDTVIRVLVQKKETLDSVLITLPARNTKLTGKIVGTFHKWLMISEEPVSILSKGDQLTLFERTLQKIDHFIWRTKCLA